MARILRRGEVWLVDFEPTKGHEIRKTRPAVIVQNDIGNDNSQMTIVVPVTSQNTESLYKFHVLLTMHNSGLPKTSKALVEQIRAIDKNRLMKRVGVLKPNTMLQIDAALKFNLALE